MKVLLIVDRNLIDLNTSSFRNYLGFIIRLGELCELVTYGPREDGQYKEWCQIKYDPRHTMTDLVKQLDIDAVIGLCYAASKFFLPVKGGGDFPLICIENDYYDVPVKVRRSWYKEHGFTNMIQRGPYSDVTHGLTTVWLPMSANEKEFYTEEDSVNLDERENKIAFVGNWHHNMNRKYCTRNEMVRVLKDFKEFEPVGDVPANEYPKVLKKYRCCMSDASGILRTALGKTYEIMASGTALLAPPMKTHWLLFGDEQTFFECREDNSDLVSLAKLIISDKDLVEAVINNALRKINKYHLHKHRLVEFYNIVDAIVSGKEIPKRWGI